MINLRFTQRRATPISPNSAISSPCRPNAGLRARGKDAAASPFLLNLSFFVLWMDAVNLSSCSAHDEEHSTRTAALFRSRLRALYRRRLVLTRAALLAQLKLLRFDLQELHSAREGPSSGAIFATQLSQQDAVSANTVQPKVANTGSALSLADDVCSERHQMLTRRVRENALKITTLASDLKSTLAANERDVDPESIVDMQQILQNVCNLVPAFPQTLVGPVDMDNMLLASFETPPPESLDMLVERALSVESKELALASLVPDSGLQEEQHVEQVNVAKSFFSEEYRLLHSTESGEISFHGQSTQESLRMSELYLLHKSKPLIPPSCHDRNFSESSMGDFLSGDSVASIVHIVDTETSSLNLSESLHFNLRQRPRRIRFPFFQRRTYFYDRGHCPDALQAATAPWYPDVDIPSSGVNSMSASMPDASASLSFTECGNNGSCTDAYRDARTSAISNPEPLSGYGYNGYRIDATRTFQAPSDSAQHPPSGYGYNGFRVDAAIPLSVTASDPAPQSKNITLNLNFQKRTTLPPQPPALGPVPYNNPDIYDMDQPVPSRDDEPCLTNPLDFLLNKWSNARGPYFDSSASPPTIGLPAIDEVDRVDEVYDINKDGSLNKPG